LIRECVYFKGETSQFNGETSQFNGETSFIGEKYILLDGL
jgi:hypothetical protein